MRTTHVIQKPSIWPALLPVSLSSVVRASDRCTEGHEFDSCQGLRFFNSSSLARDMMIASFLISLPSLTLNIFLYLSPHMMLSTFLIAGRMSRMNLVYGLVRHESLLAQYT